MHDICARIEIKPYPSVTDARDLTIEMIFDSLSNEEIRLNTRYFDFAMLNLQVRDHQGNMIRLSPPPIPPIDDDGSLIIKLQPGAEFSHELSGRDFFAIDVPVGRYEIRWSSEESGTIPGTWKGTLRSDWIPFEVMRGNRRASRSSY